VEGDVIGGLIGVAGGLVGGFLLFGGMAFIIGDAFQAAYDKQSGKEQKSSPVGGISVTAGIIISFGTYFYCIRRAFNYGD
jgi:hypothetical protein